MPVRPSIVALPALLALALGLGAAGAAAGAAPAAEPAGSAAAEPPTVRVRTSLGPIERGTGGDDGGGTRALRAKGSAPTGSRVTVRFYRGSTRLKTRRLVLGATRRGYSTSVDVDRTGDYTVRVAARAPGVSSILRATAELEYGPGAKAPSAPGNSLRR